MIDVVCVRSFLVDVEVSRGASRAREIRHFLAARRIASHVSGSDRSINQSMVLITSRKAALIECNYAVLVRSAHQPRPFVGPKLRALLTTAAA